MKNSTFSILAAILAVVAIAVGWLTFDWYRSLQGGEPYGAAFTLVDQRGDEITEQAFRGHPTALFFGFTHCPEVCPTTLFEMDGWLETLGPDGQEIRAYFVSVDPERDTPEVMENYVASVSDRITGITGDPEKVAAMVKSYHIFSRRVELDDGDYTMDHTASVILLKPDGAFHGTISYGENPDTAVAKLRRLAKSG
jgi:protein SCO1/2